MHQIRPGEQNFSKLFAKPVTLLLTYTHLPRGTSRSIVAFIFGILARILLPRTGPFRSLQYMLREEYEDILAVVLGICG